MHYTYVIQSKKDSRFYVGATSNLQKRFFEHKNNEVQSTKGRGPFVLVYYEACQNIQDAFTREKFLKTGPGKRFLKNRIKNFLFPAESKVTAGARPVRSLTFTDVSGRKKRPTSNRGFVALLSVVLISSVLLTIAIVLNTSNFYTRFNVLDYESKRISTGLAEACAETALVNLARDPVNYPATIPLPNGTKITVDTNKTCRICAVSITSPYTITTKAMYQSAYTNITVSGILNASNFTVTSWNETATGPVGCTLP